MIKHSLRPRRNVTRPHVGPVQVLLCVLSDAFGYGVVGGSVSAVSVTVALTNQLRRSIVLRLEKYRVKKSDVDHTVHRGKFRLRACSLRTKRDFRELKSQCSGPAPFSGCRMSISRLGRSPELAPKKGDCYVEGPQHGGSAPPNASGVMAMPRHHRTPELHTPVI